MRKQGTAPLTSLDPINHPCAVRLGKVLLHSVALDELLSSSSSELKHIVTVNSEIFVYAHENAALDALLKRTVNTIDGRVLHLLCSFLYPGWGLRKLSGSDFIYDLGEYASRRAERVFLLGAGTGSNLGAIEALKTRFPDLIIDGYSPSFCSDIHEQEWNDAILSRVASFRPTHLVVCFGPVKQEMWISDNADALFRLGVRCAYGLGGTLDFVSGTKRRAPKWIQAVGAEWLFRFLSEPMQRFERTTKMFKMPYFVFRFYDHEVRMFKQHGGSTCPSPQSHVA